MREDLAPVREALERTVASASARFELSLFESRMQSHELKAPKGFLGTVREDGIAFGLLRLLFAVGGLLIRLTKFGRRMRTQMAETWRPGEAEGVVDFRDWRAAADYGGYATIEADDECWSGRSGRALSTLQPGRPRAFGPLWLLSVLRGATDAHLEGEDVIAGLDCRSFAVVADLANASAHSDVDLALPPVPGFRELARLPLHAWIGPDRRLRRVSFDTGSLSHTVTFLAFDVDLPADWDHLPTFRTGTK